jgi:hypothetical protein
MTIRVVRTINPLVASKLSNKIVRGEHIFSQLENSLGLTECGRDWLIAALDPMHDSRLTKLDGWPDVEGSASVVCCVKQSVTVASNQGATANWDCHVVQWPYFDALNSRKWNRTDNRVISAPVGNFNTGGLQVYGKASDGSPLDISVGGLAELTLDTDFSQGTGRLVGAGFEVVNTTAEISQQGLCTVYRMNQPKMEPSVFITETTGSVPDLPVSAQTLRLPPTLLSDALLIPGSRQWKAKDGCYVVQSFVGQDNPPQTVGFTAPVILPNDDVPGGEGANVGGIAIAPAAGTTIGGAVGINIATKIYPIHMGGAIFTGLSAATTLTINWILYYEVFPTPTQQEMLVLSTPSATWDTVALNLYSKVVSQLPVGVQASDNASGDWFLFLADIAAEVARLSGQPVTKRGAGFMANQSAYGAPKLGVANRQRKNKQKQKASNNEIARVVREVNRADREEERMRSLTKAQRRQNSTKALPPIPR